MQREESRNEGAGSCDSHSRGREDKPRMSGLHSKHRAPVSPDDEPCRSKTPFEPISLASLAPLNYEQLGILLWLVL